MKKIKTFSDLNQAILLLETEKAGCRLNLIFEFEKTCEKLSPVNLIKRQLHKWFSGSDLGKSLLNTALTAISVYVEKKYTGVDESHPVSITERVVTIQKQIF